MHRLAGTFALALSFALSALPAQAAREFVQDQANMFSPATVSSLDSRISAFNAQTGKEVVVMTVPSLGGTTVQKAGESAFTQQAVNGVLIYIARDDRKDIILPDLAGVTAGWFPPDVIRSIRTSMESQFKAENYDGGIASAVDGILNVYRAHLGSLKHASSSAAGAPMTVPGLPSTGGFHLSMFWWIVIAIVGFLVIRAIVRAMSTPRYGGPGMMAPPGAVSPGGMPPGGYGPGYGPGYGGGYGFGGGGGSFWSGLLGGLGGAWLGNEMFGNRGGMFGNADAATTANTAGDAGANVTDAGGWANDPGQAGLSGSSSGDWGGGGFGGDGGGLGGGDFGGGGDFSGGGDSGGGW